MRGERPVTKARRVQLVFRLKDWLHKFHRPHHHAWAIGGIRRAISQGLIVTRATELIAQIKSKLPEMGADLDREFKALSSRRAFGLNFERHLPETVELPGRPVRKVTRCVFSLPGSPVKGATHVSWWLRGYMKPTAFLSPSSS